MFSDGGKIHRNYSMCYDEQNYVARWIAYPMHSYYTSGSYDSETFYQDPSFLNSEQVTNTYNNYSRGHQIAKAQRTVTAEARKQSNYYTNMTPQIQSLNGGKWNTLENKERGAWMCSDTLYVVSGCHFDNYNTKCTNDDGKTCPVPTHYFKVMLRTKAGNTRKSVQECSASELICAGYWVKHGENSAVTPEFKSVSEIEQLTGFTFFVNVPNAPKSTKATEFQVTFNN
jgi:endonuclease G